jgi:hypothetical protein
LRSIYTLSNFYVFWSAQRILGLEKVLRVGLFAH